MSVTSRHRRTKRDWAKWWDEKQAQPGYVYFALHPSSGLYKIGSSKTPDVRVRQLCHASEGVLLAHKVFCDRAYTSWESRFHTAFIERHVGGEWFRLTAEDLVRICRVVEIREADRRTIPHWLEFAVQYGRSFHAVHRANPGAPACVNQKQPSNGKPVGRPKRVPS